MLALRALGMSHRLHAEERPVVDVVPAEVSTIVAAETAVALVVAATAGAFFCSAVE